jgi:hypothetical protein
MSNKMIRLLDDLDLQVQGRLPRIARLRDEYYVEAPAPQRLIPALQQAGGADVLTFVQPIDDPQPHHPWPLSFDEMAALRVSSFEHWFERQLTTKPRNKLRKAWKSGVQVSVAPFDDALVAGIMDIYNESPLRQGKPNRHYGKDFDTVRREHATFLDRSEFLCARAGGELLGFAKLTHAPRCSTVMNIIAKVSARDRAPMNALIAQCVERTAARDIPLLNYGIWGRRGLNEFKTANGFECVRVPRYHVALTAAGALALRLGLHRGLKERLPEAWIVRAADARARLYERLQPLLPARRPARPVAAGEAES